MAKQTGDNNEQNKPKRIKKVKPANTKKKQKKINRNKPLRQKTSMNDVKQKYITHTGEKLSTLQGKFVNLYIELGNQRQAVIQAGYKVKNPDVQANQLLRIPKIADEINWRLQEMTKESIANADEILQYYTRVMRGEEKDQFGLDAPLNERTKAASELAKRLIDIPNKLEGRAQAQLTISLDWDGLVENGQNNTEELDQNDNN